MNELLIIIFFIFVLLPIFIGLVSFVYVAFVYVAYQINKIKVREENKNVNNY